MDSWLLVLESQNVVFSCTSWDHYLLCNARLLLSLMSSGDRYHWRERTGGIKTYICKCVDPCWKVPLLGHSVIPFQQEHVASLSQSLLLQSSQGCPRRPDYLGLTGTLVECKLMQYFCKMGIEEGSVCLFCKLLSLGTGCHLECIHHPHWSVSSDDFPHELACVSTGFIPRCPSSFSQCLVMGLPSMCCCTLKRRAREGCQPFPYFQSLEVVMVT